MDVRNFIRRCQSPDFFLVLYKTRKKSGYSVGETPGKNGKSREKNLNKFLNANLQKTFLSYIRLERNLEIGTDCCPECSANFEINFMSI